MRPELELKLPGHRDRVLEHAVAVGFVWFVLLKAFNKNSQNKGKGNKQRFFFFFKDPFTYLMFVYVPKSMHVYQVYVWYPQRTEGMGSWK